MKWSISFVCLLVCLAKFCEGWALRCPPGVRDSSCTEENKEVETDESISSAQAQCLAGTEWESNCHYCRCSDLGVAECVRQNTCSMELFVEPALCKPNTTFLRDCNTCVCLDNGLGLCTLHHCRRTHDTPETSDVRTSEKVSTKQLEIPAAPLPIPKNSDEQNFPQLNQIMLKFTTLCKPHEEFMKDCNPCKCSDNGLSFTCTKNECLDGDKNTEVEVFKEGEGVDHIESHSVCRARQTFNIGCNTCHCNKFGTDYSCTNKVCPLPPDVEIFDRVEDINPVTPYTIDDGLKTGKENATKPQVCVANRMFVKDCNTCLCNEDGTSYVCTRRTCVPLLPDEEPDLGGIPTEDLRVTIMACRPNEVFELDCNTCRCNPDGKSYSCTRRVCAESEDQERTVLSRKVRSFTTEMTKTCQPGQEFRMDCNTCLCDNEGRDFSCTRNDCNSNQDVRIRRKRETPTTADIDAKCIAGSVFDRDCNVCRCTADGNHATCTIKRCKQDTNSEGHPTESDGGFRCNPGEQFKRGCNDCTCSADGKSEFCTILMCDEDIATSM